MHFAGRNVEANTLTAAGPSKVDFGGTLRPGGTPKESDSVYYGTIIIIHKNKMLRGAELGQVRAELGQAPMARTRTGCPGLSSVLVGNL